VFGRYLGREGICKLILTMIGISFSVSVIAFYEVGLKNSVVSIRFFDWITVGFVGVSWGFLFDTITVIMLVVVTGVSFLVHMYSIGYMYEDPHFIRFMAFLSLFTFFMLCLVTADNLLQAFLGWEGVGVSSYLLINFWFTREEANSSALKAVVINRVGDLGFALGIFLVYITFRSLNYGVVFPLVSLMSTVQYSYAGVEFDLVFWICIFLFVGVIGKSAQIGLHTWLPDAMEGPTPVSALIHAATMVTAGVFLLVRCSPIFEVSPEAIFVVCLFGSFTAFFAGTIGGFQFDLKRVIAYSTCSQLGYMVLSCGLGCYDLAMFHLMTHACFKALLFLSAGCVIHGLGNEQDMRKMGGLFKLLPISYIMFIVGSFGLMAFPFTSGYYSKDFILELSLYRMGVNGFWLYFFSTISAVLTTIYSVRLLYYTFLGETGISRQTFKIVHDAPKIMVIPLIVLSFCTLFVGYAFQDLFVGLGTPFFQYSLFSSVFLDSPHSLDIEFSEDYLKYLPFLCSFMISVLLLFFFEGSFAAKFGVGNYVVWVNYPMVMFFMKKWFFDVLQNIYIVKEGFWFCHAVIINSIDRGVLEFFGLTGLVRGAANLSKFVVLLNSGFVYHGIFIMFVGLNLIFYLLLTYFMCVYLSEIFGEVALLLVLILYCRGSQDNGITANSNSGNVIRI